MSAAWSDRALNRGPTLPLPRRGPLLHAALELLHGLVRDGVTVPPRSARYSAFAARRCAGTLPPQHEKTTIRQDRRAVRAA
jgi:hypothetical protein